MSRFHLKHYLLLITTVSSMAGEIPALRPPHPELQPSFWEQYGWLFILIALIVLPLPVWWALWFRRTNPAPLATPCQMARRALEALQKCPENGESIVQATQILRRCIIAVSDLPPQELTTTEFRQLPQIHEKLGADLARDIIDFLHRCDALKFAPSVPERRIAVINDVLAFVARIETRQQATTLLPEQLPRA